MPTKFIYKNKTGVFCFTFSMYFNKTVGIPTTIREKKQRYIGPYESLSIQRYFHKNKTKKGFFNVSLVFTSNKTVAIQQ